VGLGFVVSMRLDSGCGGNLVFGWFGSLGCFVGNLVYFAGFWFLGLGVFWVGAIQFPFGFGCRDFCWLGGDFGFLVVLI